MKTFARISVITISPILALTIGFSVAGASTKSKIRARTVSPTARIRSAAAGTYVPCPTGGENYSFSAYGMIGVYKTNDAYLAVLCGNIPNGAVTETAHAYMYLPGATGWLDVGNLNVRSTSFKYDSENQMWLIKIDSGTVYLVTSDGQVTVSSERYAQENSQRQIKRL